MKNINHTQKRCIFRYKPICRYIWFGPHSHF